MNKVLTSLLVLPFVLVFQAGAVEASATTATTAVAKDTLATVLARVNTVAHYCANGVKQGAQYVSSKATVLAGTAWEKMPVSVKEKVTYAWEKTTSTTSGKVASATVAAAVVVAAIYKLSHQIHGRVPACRTAVQ